MIQKVRQKAKFHYYQKKKHVQSPTVQVDLTRCGGFEEHQWLHPKEDKLTLENQMPISYPLHGDDNLILLGCKQSQNQI